jgi:serine phosphatase RsbU (regulator of sigma subunit)
MDPAPSSEWPQFTARLDRETPHLRVLLISIYVRDQERSLRFYVDQLGFRLAFDNHVEGGGRFLVVAPPDGTAVFALVTPEPGSRQYDLIGRSPDIVLVCEDVMAKYEEWSARGVTFVQLPQEPLWGGLFAGLEDIDGNSLKLVGSDGITQELDAHRQVLAERQETERRAAHELEIATHVQSRLFPQSPPPLRTLDYAGSCIQARHVGGDYFDFLKLGPDRLGLVVGDIAGKGMAAALLMASLQANLRSQSAVVTEPKRLLCSVNRVFFENTDSWSYASLIFTDYDDKTRRLRYANCGHFPGLLLRSTGVVERLESTAPVLGVFDVWDCQLIETSLERGDMLVLYTDGVTEAFNPDGEEFGEARLIEELQARRTMAPRDLIASIVTDVHQFNPDEQRDDITMIVAIGR